MALNEMVPASIGWLFRNLSFSHRYVYLLLLVCLGVAAPPIAAANALQGPHVLELMVSNLSGVRTLKVEQQVTLEESAFIEKEAVLKETLAYSFPERFRSDTWLANSHRIHVAVANESLTIIDGQISSLQNPLDRYKDLLLYRSRTLIHKKLYLYGVDVEKISLGRFGERTVYVLGADYPDESASQVMIDKERLLPLRWLHSLGQKTEERLEFVYSDWQKQGETWYPMRIEIYSNQRLVRRIRAVNIAVNAVLPADTFDISHLKRIYPPAPSIGPPRPSSTPSEDEVRKTIEEFQKKFSTE